VLADEMEPFVSDKSTGKQTRLTENLKAVTDSKDEATARGKLFEGFHDRRKTCEGAGAEIVPIRESARNYNRVVRGKIRVSVPDEIDRLPHMLRYDVIGVMVAIRTWKDYYPELHVAAFSNFA
jgi:hypothetical protein